MTFQQTQQTNGALHTPTSLVPFRELANQIYDMRMKLGLNQIEMGKLLEVSGPTISMWERGNPPHGPNLEMLRKFIADNQDQVMGTKEPRQETITFVDPDATDEIILPRQDQLALRFKGKRLGSLVASSDLRIVLYLTTGGKVVWWVSPTAMHGDVQDFLRWVQDHSRASERVKKDIITYAASVGLQIFEDIE